MDKFTKGELAGWIHVNGTKFVEVVHRYKPKEYVDPPVWMVKAPQIITRFYVDEPYLVKLNEYQQQDYVLAKLEDRTYLNEVQ